MQQTTSFWVFGYGSLVWRPGFSALSRQPARLLGAHRRLCVYSFRHRGTEAQPGLVFGLVRGGSCRGMAFEVGPENWSAVQDYLREREMDRGVYRETHRPIRLASGANATAMTFIVDERHPQYAGRLSLVEQVRLVAAGVGESGPNLEYVLETASGLAAIDIRDRYIDALVEALKAAQGRSQATR